MYKIINDTLIERLDDGAAIPRDVANIHYQAFLEWERAGGVIEPVDMPSLGALRAAKEAEINSAYSAAASSLAEGYPDAERVTWPVQIAESEIVLGGADGSTPWIDAAAAARGVSREDLATKIRDMDLQYRQISGALTGKRQALRDQVQLADTPEAIAAVAWD